MNIPTSSFDSFQYKILSLESIIIISLISEFVFFFSYKKAKQWQVINNRVFKGISSSQQTLLSTGKLQRLALDDTLF